MAPTGTVDNEDDTVVSTAEGIVNNVKQLSLRMQSCVETLEMVSSAAGTGEHEQLPKISQERQYRSQITLTNSRYSGGGTSQPTGSLRREAAPSHRRRSSEASAAQGGGSEQRDSDSSTPHGLNGLIAADSVGGAPSDEQEWDVGDEYDACVDLGMEDPEEAFTPRGPLGHGHSRDMSASQQPVTVGVALKALKENLSSQVKTSLKGVNVPSHGEQLREQSSKAVTDTVQKRLLGRAGDFNRSGSLTRSGVEEESAPASLRTASETFGRAQQLTQQASETRTFNRNSTTKSTAASLATQSMPSRNGPVDHLPQSINSPARPSTGGIGVLRRGEIGSSSLQKAGDGIGSLQRAGDGTPTSHRGDDGGSSFQRTGEGASSAGSRRESMDAQRPGQAKSKIPPPPAPAHSFGRMETPSPLATPGSAAPGPAETGLQPQPAEEPDVPPSPAAVPQLPALLRVGDSSVELLRRTDSMGMGRGSAGRGWRFAAAESGGTIAVSIGSGTTDDVSLTPTPRASLGPFFSLEASTSESPALAPVGFMPPPGAFSPAGAGDSRTPQQIGFVPPPYAFPSNTTAAITPAVGFTPPLEALAAQQHSSISSSPAPTVGFMPPPEVFAPPSSAANAPAPAIGFMPPPEVFSSSPVGFSPPPHLLAGSGNLSGEPGANSVTDTRNPSKARPLVSQSLADPPRADLRAVLQGSQSMQVRDRPATMPLRTVETVRQRVDSAAMPLGGADPACMIPPGDFSFGINAHVFSSNKKLVLRSSTESNASTAARSQEQQPQQSAGRRGPAVLEGFGTVHSHHHDSVSSSLVGGGSNLQLPNRARASTSSRLSRISSVTSHGYYFDDGGEPESELPGKMPWEESSDEDDEGEDEQLLRAEQEGGSTGSGEVPITKELTQGGAGPEGDQPPKVLRLQPPPAALALPHDGNAGAVDAEQGTPSPGFHAPSFSDHSRVSSPTMKVKFGATTQLSPAEDGPAQPSKSATAPLAPPLPLQPPPLGPQQPRSAAASRGASPPRSVPPSPPLSPIRKPASPADLNALGQAPASPLRTSNSGVSITISEADIARAGGVVSALLEVVRERFRQKGIQSLAQLATAAEAAATAPGSPGLKRETLAERIVARVESFQTSRRSTGGYASALKPGSEGEEGYPLSAHSSRSPSMRRTTTDSGDRPSPATGRSPAVLSSATSIPNTAPRSPRTAGSVTASAASSSKSMSEAALRGSISSPPILDLPKPTTAPVVAPGSADSQRSATSRIPAPAPATSRTPSRIAATSTAKTPSASHSPSPTASPQTSPRPSAGPGASSAPVVASPGAASPGKVERGTQTPPQPASQPSPSPGAPDPSPVSLGTARDFFLSATVPLAQAGDRGRATRGGGGGLLAYEERLLQPDMPAICTAADFFRGAASRATINTSAMATPLRELPTGVSFASPFLEAQGNAAAAIAASYPYGRSAQRPGREAQSLNGTPSTASRSRRQSASGRAAVSAGGGLMGRTGSTGRRVSNGGGRVVIDDEPVDLTTLSSSRTLSYLNRRASMGASTGATTRVAFDDSEPMGGTSAAPSPRAAGASVGASGAGRGLTREVLMHLAHLPSEGRHAFDTTTDEEREEQERQARRRARQRRASGPGESGAPDSAAQRVTYASASVKPRGESPRSSPAAGVGTGHGHTALHAHFKFAAGPMAPSPRGAPAALPRHLAAVITEGHGAADAAGVVDSPGIAAAPGDEIPLPPLSLDAPDMPEPGGGDAAACARSVTQLPHETFFIPQSPAWAGKRAPAAGLSPPAASGAAGPRRGALASGTGMGGPAVQQLSRLSQASGLGVSVDGAAPQSRRRRRSSAAADSWDSPDQNGSGSEGPATADGARGPGRQRMTAAEITGNGSRGRAKETPKSPGGRRRASASGADSPAALAHPGRPGSAFPPNRHPCSSGGRATANSDDDFDLGSVPYDVYDLDDTDVPDLDERDPSTRSVSRGEALSPSSTSASVLSQSRYVAAVRAHRSVSEANSAKRVSSGAPPLTEAEDGEEEDREDVGPSGPSRRGAGAATGTDKGLPTGGGRDAGATGRGAARDQGHGPRRSDAHAGMPEADEQARRSVRIRSQADGHRHHGPVPQSRPRSEPGDFESDLPYASSTALRKEPGHEGSTAVAPAVAAAVPMRLDAEPSGNGGDSGGGVVDAAAMTPNGTRIRQSLQRLLDMRATAASGRSREGAVESAPPAPVTRRHMEAAATLGTSGLPVPDGNRPSRSPSVTATAGGTTEADAADRNALLRRHRDRDEGTAGRREPGGAAASIAEAGAAATGSAQQQSRLQQARPKPLLPAGQQEPQRRQRRGSGDGGSSASSNDAPPEDPQALLSPNYTQDMAEDEYGWDAATGDAEVDNLTSPRGRRVHVAGSGGGGGGRRRKPGTATTPRSPLPYDPSEVPSVGVDDVNASYTGELEEQELRDVIAELARLLPTGAAPGPGRAGAPDRPRLPRTSSSLDAAEKEPSFSLEPRVVPTASVTAPRTATAAPAYTGAAAAGMLTASSRDTDGRKTSSSSVPDTGGVRTRGGSGAPGAARSSNPISVTEALFLALSSPRAREASTAAPPVRPASASTAATAAGFGLRVATTSPPSTSVGRGSLGHMDSLSPPLSASRGSRRSLSPPGSPSPGSLGSLARLTQASGHGAGAGASSTVPVWLATALGGTVSQSPDSTSVRNRQRAASAAPRLDARRPFGSAAATAPGPAQTSPSVSPTLAQVLASIRPIPRPSSKPRAAQFSPVRSHPAALTQPSLPGAAAPGAAASHPDAQAPAADPRTSTGLLGTASESSGASTRTSTASEPDPELRMLLLTAWSRWYLRRCAAAASGASPTRGGRGTGAQDGADAGSDAGADADLVAAEAQAQAQARLQVMTKTHAWARPLAWDGLGSSPGMQEAANFSRLYITFTRWLGQARSTRQARRAQGAGRRWAQPWAHLALPSDNNRPAPLIKFDVAAPPSSLALPTRPVAPVLRASSQTREVAPGGGAVGGGSGSASSLRLETQMALAANVPTWGTDWSAALRQLLSAPASKATRRTSEPQAGPARGPEAAAAASRPGAATGHAGAGGAAATAMLAGLEASGKARRNLHSTPTISRTSGVRQVMSQPPRQELVPQQQHQTGYNDAVELGTSHAPVRQSAGSGKGGLPSSQLPASFLAQPLASAPTGEVPGSATRPHVAASYAPAVRGGAALATSVPAMATAAAAGMDDLESLFALHLLDGLGEGSDGVILAGLQLAAGGAFPPSNVSPRRSPNPQHGSGLSTAAQPFPRQLHQGPSGNLKLRPASTGRMGAQKPPRLGPPASSAMGTGGTGGSILARPLAGQPHAPQAPSLLAAKISGPGSVPGAGAGPTSEVGLGMMVAGGGGPHMASIASVPAHGNVSLGSLSRPASPARPVASRTAAHNIRPQSPMRATEVNDNIRARAPGGSGQLNLSYYGIKQ